MERASAGTAASWVNRALAGEGWALARLAAHAGCSFRLRAGPMSAHFAIAADGTLRAADADAAPVLTLTVSPFDLPGLAAEPTRWREGVRADGDAGLARTIEDLATTLPWFVERALSNVLGPVLGQQVADIGREVLAWPGAASRKLTGHLARYASEESDLLVRRAEAAGPAEEIGRLEERVDALVRRVAALERPPS